MKSLRPYQGLEYGHMLLADHKPLMPSLEEKASKLLPLVRTAMVSQYALSFMYFEPEL